MPRKVADIRCGLIAVEPNISEGPLGAFLGNVFRHCLKCGIGPAHRGAAMPPHHTRKGNRRYCFYVSMKVIQKRPMAELRGPQRLPAAMVEEAVIGEVRRLLRPPEIIARTARALKKERPDLDESTLTASLTQFDDLWKALIPAAQARVVQLLVARVTVGEDGLDINLRHDGLGALASPHEAGA